MKKITKTTHRFYQRIRSRVKKSNGKIIFLFAMVLTRRVKVANELNEKSNPELLAAGTRYYTEMTGQALFITPVPALADVEAALLTFEGTITNAAGGGHEETSLLDAQRETVLNLLTSLGSYVEVIANLPDNGAIGAPAVIEAAGMRPKPYSPRDRQQWGVERGVLSGTLKLTAATIERGTHDWQYTTTPTVFASWISAPSTTRANTIISGLTSGSFVSCRHRTVERTGTSDWQGADPVVVG